MWNYDENTLLSNKVELVLDRWCDALNKSGGDYNHIDDEQLKKNGGDHKGRS